MITITTIEVINGEPMLDVNAMSLLFGVAPDAITATLRENPAIPYEWVQAGRRRAREAMSRTGSDDLLDALSYWARQDHHCELQVIYQ
jgi:hypothetical protein